MLERLLEHWLDSVNERSYQPAFCQLLAAQGFKVLHSTRHMPLEFGKDIIALDPHGRLCAFQLKGNPGSRLTLSQFREIAPQLQELVTQKVVYPGAPNKPHLSYLVTNGYIEEEVQRAIDDFNRRLEGMGFPQEQHLNIITRGEFLSWLQRFGSSIWPIEISPMNALLELLVIDGASPLPQTNLDKVLKGILGLNESKSIRNATELKRRIFSAAVMVSLSLTRYEEKKNNFAIVSAWVIYTAYVHAACDRYGFSLRNGGQAIEIARGRIFSGLEQIILEIADRIEKLKTHEKAKDQQSLFKMALVESGGLSDFIGMPGRTVLISGLISLYWLWCEDEGWSSDDFKTLVERIFPVPLYGLDLWGEAVIPQILIHFWHWEKVDPTPNPDFALSGLLGHLLHYVTDASGKGIPSPYFTYEDVARHAYQRVLPSHTDKLENENLRNTSHTVEGLLHLLVRTNLKTQCKIHWPDVSRVMTIEFKPKERWQFCLIHCDEGKTLSIQREPTKVWSKLKDDARSISFPEIPPSMLEDKFLLMLFSIVLPQRCTSNMIRRLGYLFCDTWFLEDPIE